MKRRCHQSPELRETNTQVKNALSTLNKVLTEKSKNDAEDDCDLYAKLLAKKLRQYPLIDRQEVMYEIDGLLLKKSVSLNRQANPFNQRDNSTPSHTVINGNRPPSSLYSFASSSSPLLVDCSSTYELSESSPVLFSPNGQSPVYSSPVRLIQQKHMANREHNKVKNSSQRIIRPAQADLDNIVIEACYEADE